MFPQVYSVENLFPQVYSVESSDPYFKSVAMMQKEMMEAQKEMIEAQVDAMKDLAVLASKCAEVSTSLESHGVACQPFLFNSCHGVVL